MHTAPDPDPRALIAAIEAFVNAVPAFVLAVVDACEQHPEFAALAYEQGVAGGTQAAIDGVREAAWCAMETR